MRKNNKQTLISLTTISSILGISILAIFHSNSISIDDTTNPNIQTIIEAEQTLKANLQDSKNQMAKEMQEIATQYSLPTNATFHSEHSFSEISQQLMQVQAQKQARTANNNIIEIEPVWYEPGFFKSDALVQWQCAWLKEAVIAQENNNTSRLNIAITTLEEFPKKPEISMFPDYAIFLKDNLDPIKNGDTKPARDFINSGYSCVPQNQLNNS